MFGRDGSRDGDRDLGDGTGDVAPERHLDGMELAEDHAVEVDLDRRHPRRDRRVVRERRAEDQKAVRLGDGLTGDRNPGPAEHTAAERVVVGERPLRLERRDDRRVEVLGERHDCIAMRTGAVADDDRRPLSCSQQFDRPRHLVDRRGDAAGGDPTGAGAGRRILDAGQVLDLVRQHEVRDVALDDGVLHRQRGELGGVRRREHGLGPFGDGVERLRQRHLLERAGPDDLGLDLSGERDDRHAVDLGVPQAGQEIGRARAGDREARRGAAGELGVARRRERGRTLVADADIGEASVGLGLAQSVGHAEVGMADHPEHGLEAPVAENVDHLVHEADLGVVGRDLDLDGGVVTLDGPDGVRRRGVAEPRRWLAR